MWREIENSVDAYIFMVCLTACVEFNCIQNRSTAKGWNKHYESTETTEIWAMQNKFYVLLHSEMCHGKFYNATSTSYILMVAARGRYNQLRAEAGFSLSNVTAGQQFDEKSYSLIQAYMWCVIDSVIQSNTNWKCLARTVLVFSSDIKYVQRKCKQILSQERVEGYLLQGCCK